MAGKVSVIILRPKQSENALSYLNSPILLIIFKEFFMALNLSDVEKIAKLSRLSLTENEKTKTLSELNDIFAMVEKMQSVNTDGVEPMPHPHETALRLREDAVTETDHAAEYQAVAPEVRNRLYIVPQVIEE
ncbi:aspartyl/glutamyl-tRNA amidotransferase subunit C [Neisseria elongata subsp. glycolytica ATCC 29315]|uniref:Aspartyl/glutamyl-tRNA(Asn/Gln) amidotransferase subunit C n=5 Tax=root TaxID=1 RepID=D4DNS8_NEIEG|nr:aspartyl/glutamyl-tRNA amidotransferase subunit C [Neisseria elongata subsp. glycolytica ATCC 29315]